MVTLETVHIPGLREAVQREARIRDTAWLDGLELVCGVEVVPISLRRMIWLEQAHNGFICPWKFESDKEYMAHALQVVYFCRPDFSPPKSPKYGLVAAFLEGRRRHMFFRRVLRYGDYEKITKEIEEWLSDAFMDSPKGGGRNEVSSTSYASYPAYILDRFGESGLSFSYVEIMDMPLRRLWQLMRLASSRIDNVSLTNPSDEIATNHIASKRQ